jgi:hypothetical protein
MINKAATNVKDEVRQEAIVDNDASIATDAASKAIA